MLSALHRASSLPSLQSRRPSQTRDLNDEDEDFADDDDDYDYLSIHWPLLHVASVTAQAEGGRAVAAAPWESALQSKTYCVGGGRRDLIL